MANKNALITNAMLASYLNEKQVDYLGMIEPFILKSLPESFNSPIDISVVSKCVNDEYGLDIKQKIVEKILNRLAKEKNGSLVKRQSVKSDRIYYVNKKIDNTQFDNRKERMEKLVSEVVTKLMEYINSNYKKISYEESQKYFIDFLNDYNYELYSTVDNLRKIQSSEKHHSSNFRVAKFILSEYEKKDGCYKKIKEIQSGYFASVAIYYFCNSSNIDNPIKLIDNTSIILDTRLLIDVLGLNRSSETESMRELLSLIKDNGGRLCTFDYYIDELDGIIKKYLNDSSARLTLDLDFFRRNKVGNAEIITYRKNLRTIIEDNNINILKDVDYTKLINEITWHIDELELKSNMLKLIDYEYRESDTAFINDYKSLLAISYYKYRNVKYNEEKAIFVTSNSGIIKAAQQTFKDNIFQDNINIVISDIDLAAVLWLSNYNSKSSLPDLILLENAYAAICPSKTILNEVLQIIDNNIQSKDELISNNALLLRYDEHILNDISEITNNDESYIGTNLYEELSSRMKNRIRKEVISEEAKKIKENLSKEMHHEYEMKYLNKYDELEIKEEDLKQKEQNILKKEKASMEAISKSIMLESKNDELQNKNKNLTANYQDVIDHAIHTCETISKILKICVKTVLIIIVSLLMFFILYNCIKVGYESISSNLDFSNIINQIIVITGTILTFCPVELFCLKLIKKISNSFYDFVYQKIYNSNYILKKNK